MRRLLILGAGTAGTMTANKMRRRLDAHEWSVTVVDRDDEHHYQPGYLFVPFGGHTRADLVRSRHHFLADGINLVQSEIAEIQPGDRSVRLVDGRSLEYDLLVVATGTSPRPEEVEGMTGPLWRESIFDFYTLDGAEALHDALERFSGGHLVVHLCELPVKCPVAPLEFVFLVEAWLRDRGLRDTTELTFVTPLDGAFTKPVAAEHLGGMLAERKVHVETDFMTERVDNERKVLVSYDEREVPFDLLVTVPVNMGAECVARSGLGDELNHVRVDKHTLRSLTEPEVFAVGDAADLPTSKAGSVAHFSVEVLVENLVATIEGRPLEASFDGHANCFIESGQDRALLIDFNYTTEPLPGKYPIPRVGPMTLLEETRLNHLGKLAFRHLYWNVLLPGYPLPVPTQMKMAGKVTTTEKVHA